MKIELIDVPVRELVAGYSDNGDDGVVGYDGELDIRPPFQREFVYDDDQQAAVIDTVIKGFPLNIMYWGDRGEGQSPRYEIIDGQQRTISVAQYVNKKFSIRDPNSGHMMFFSGLSEDKQKVILDYEVTVYVCSGTDTEKLDRFEIVNIAGERLTAQEIRNAVYFGSWVTDAKRWFSRRGGPAQKVAGKYLTGQAIRQDYLETAIQWVCGIKKSEDIDTYMSTRREVPDAEELWRGFEKIIKWVKDTFPEYRKPMKQVDWGPLHDAHKNETLDSDMLEAEVARLMADDEVRKKQGIYRYVLTREARHLNLRSFNDAQRETAYERQNGVCPMCDKSFDIVEMHADHITPWSKGGRTVDDNCQMLCGDCNRSKGAR